MWMLKDVMWDRDSVSQMLSSRLNPWLHHGVRARGEQQTMIADTPLSSPLLSPQQLSESSLLHLFDGGSFAVCYYESLLIHNISRQLHVFSANMPTHPNSFSHLCSFSILLVLLLPISAQTTWRPHHSCVTYWMCGPVICDPLLLISHVVRKTQLQDSKAESCAVCTVQ